MITDMPTPVTYAADEVEQVRSIVKRYIESTGVTVTSIAADANVPRAFLYRFLSGSYEHSPKYEDICRLLSAVGYRLKPEKK
jgi:predicted transcriptional regulator